MRKLTLSLTATLVMLSILTGCSTKPVPVVEAFFCDVEEPRKFSQEEIDWRVANAPWNLRKDFKTNETGKRECDWFTQ